MIQANELRIGNFFKEGEVVAIPNEGKEDVVLRKISLSFEELTPIPLTEEWLLRFGFDKNGIIYIGLDTSCSYLQVNLNYICSCLWNQEKTEFIAFAKIQYVHQLQNLCFALTGKELVLIGK